MDRRAPGPRAGSGCPAPVWQYFATGADEGVSAAEAVAAWRRVRLAPHALRDVTTVDTSVDLLGTTYAQPFGIAPTSMQRAADPEGERAMARAATAAGVPHVVSSNAGFPLAEIGAVGPWWVQAYLTADRADALPVLRRPPTRVRRRAVVLTADTPVVGTKRGVVDADWGDVDLSWHRSNFAEHVRDDPGRVGAGPDRGRHRLAGEATGLPVVVKGILRADDARRCVAAGAAAVWVSNHGGRQLDRAVASATALPEVVAEVGRQGAGVRRRGSAVRPRRADRAGPRCGRGLPRPDAAPGARAPRGRRASRGRSATRRRAAGGAAAGRLPRRGCEARRPAARRYQIRLLGNGKRAAAGV